MANIEADIRQLESLSNKDKNLGDVFYLNYCQAFYNIQTHHLPEALNYLQQAESINRQCQHSYFFLMIEYLYACYYTESKEYTKALNIFDTYFITHSNSRFIQISSHTTRTSSVTGIDGKE